MTGFLSRYYGIVHRLSLLIRWWKIIDLHLHNYVSLVEEIKTVQLTDSFRKKLDIHIQLVHASIHITKHTIFETQNKYKYL